MLDENDANTEGEKPDKQEKTSTSSYKKSDMDPIREDEDEDEFMNRNEPIIKLTNVTALWEEFETNKNAEKEMISTQCEDNKEISDVSDSLQKSSSTASI